MKQSTIRVILLFLATFFGCVPWETPDPDTDDVFILDTLTGYEKECVAVITGQSEYVHGLRPASALFLYHLAIRLAKMRISDSGIDIRAVAAVLKRLGCCDDAIWSFDVDKIRTIPPFEAFWDVTKRSGCSYAFVREAGDDRLGKLARALNAGCPVVAGLDIDEAFFSYDGTSVLQLPGGEMLGRQFVVLVGRDLTRTRFKALCSFRSNWGAGCYCWLSDAYVGSTSCWDACILHGFDAVQEQLTNREATEMMSRSRTR